MKVGCCAKMQEYDRVCTSGYDYIELAGRAVSGLSDCLFQDLSEKINTGPIPCLALNGYCPPEIVIAGPGYNREEARAYARRLAFRADALGVQVVNIGSPLSRVLPPEFSRFAANCQIRSFYRDTAEEFARYGITVAVEALGPCYCNFVNKLQEALEIVQDVSMPNLQLVLDFYNMEHSGEGDAALNDLLPYICHTHISDDAGSPSQRSFLEEHRFALHRERLSRLKAAGYDKNISIEIDVPVELDAAVKSQSLIRQVWG